MKQIKINFLFFTLILLPCNLLFSARIRKIDSINNVQAIFNNASEHDLFVFDVDQVMLEIMEPTIQPVIRKLPKIAKIKNNFRTFCTTRHKGKTYWETMRSKRLLKANIEPIEQTLINNIIGLQQKRIKVIALTAIKPGKFGVIERMEDWRYNQLVRLGVDLCSSFGALDFSFDELRTPRYAADYKTTHHKNAQLPVFYKGIIGSGSYPKGVVLRSFLKKLALTPAHIYFFDDSTKHVESVVHEMRKIGIACQGFIYGAANKLRKKPNLQVVNFQHELMKQRDNGEYIPYFEAEKIWRQQTLALPIKVKSSMGQRISE